MLLAGDIGGTKTVLALFSNENGPHYPLYESRYESARYSSLLDIIVEFMEASGVRPGAAAIAIAGPVRDNRVQVTNLPWTIDGYTIGRVLGGISVSLINDLEAIANAIPMLEADDLINVKPGDRDPRGPIAVLAPGTGLGEAFLFWDGHRYRAIPSEGGHTDFAPANPLELELLAFLQPRLGHVSYERVCSGIGIPNLFYFLVQSGRYEIPDWLVSSLEGVEDQTPVIVQAALDGTSEICLATLDLFLGILGSEAGNLVLQVLASGGVYLGGGIPPRILTSFKRPVFTNAFSDKGRFTDFLKQVPIDVIVNPKAALFGAANYGLIRMSERRKE